MFNLVQTCPDDSFRATTLRLVFVLQCSVYKHLFSISLKDAKERCFQDALEAENGALMCLATLFCIECKPYNKKMWKVVTTSVKIDRDTVYHDTTTTICIICLILLAELLICNMRQHIQ